MVSAPRSGRGGRRFKSSHPDQPTVTRLPVSHLDVDSVSHTMPTSTTHGTRSSIYTFRCRDHHGAPPTPHRPRMAARPHGARARFGRPCVRLLLRRRPGVRVLQGSSARSRLAVTNGWGRAMCSVGPSGGPWVQPMTESTGVGPVLSVNSWECTFRSGMAGPLLHGTSIKSRGSATDAEVRGSPGNLEWTDSSGNLFGAGNSVSLFGAGNSVSAPFLKVHVGDGLGDRFGRSHRLGQSDGDGRRRPWRTVAELSCRRSRRAASTTARRERRQSRSPALAERPPRAPGTTAPPLVVARLPPEGRAVSAARRLPRRCRR